MDLSNGQQWTYRRLQCRNSIPYDLIIYLSSFLS
uniref:Uncharacterized protein n=1 Tax=Arundo donax TaxID=35708 RepID=A0A0A9BUJ0_ARUDO